LIEIVTSSDPSPAERVGRVAGRRPVGWGCWSIGALFEILFKFVIS
jgi:hypothetical protein